MRVRVKEAWKKGFICIITILLFVTMMAPVIYMLASSVMSSNEILHSYQVSNGDYMNFHLIPKQLSFEQYYKAFFREPEFLKMFWNSMIYTVPTMMGQILISIVGAYAFAKIRFWGRDKIFFVCIVLLLLPTQVTIVPNYIILNKIGLLNSRLSIILPGIFSALGICLLRQSMRYVSDDSIEAARLEGAGELQILIKIVLPQIKGGLASAILLSFIEFWNMVEQPLIYLRDDFKYPLSLYLSTINENKLGISFACGVIFMIPIIFIYCYLHREFIYSAFGEDKNEKAYD